MSGLWLATKIIINLKQVCRFASLSNNIHITADPTPVDVDHIVYSANHGDPPTLT